METPELVPAPGDPAVVDWLPISLAGLVERLRTLTASAARPPIVAVDGRGGGGKSTLAARLVAAIPGAVLVGTDDFAWHAPLFGWSELILDGLLVPLAEGRSVRYRPPAWDAHGRDGFIEVPADASMIVLEGVGASWDAFADYVDVAIWVQSDFMEAERRGIARDIESGVNGDAEASVAFWHEWMEAELRFHAADRAWERAMLIVAGTRPGVADGSTASILYVPGPRE